MKAVIITYNDSYDYETRTKYVYRYLKEKGYDTRFVIADFDHRKKERYEANREYVEYIHVPSYKRNVSLARLFSCYVFAKKIGKYIKTHPVDLVYHCAPPNSTIKELSNIKKKKNFFLITEIGDMWPESMPVGIKVKAALSFPFKIWSSFRDKYLFNSDYIIAECDLFRNSIVKKVCTDNIQTIYFCKEWGENERIPELTNNEIVLCYLGSINNIIDIDIISLLVRKIANEQNVIIHIIGDGERREELLASLRMPNVKVFFHGIVFDDKEKKSIFDKCHFGLNIMKTDVFVGMTMKSLDYFSNGLPVINNISGDIGEMVENKGIGINVDLASLDEVTEKLRNMNDEQYLEMRKNVQNVHERYFSMSSFKTSMDKVIEKKQ